MDRERVELDTAQQGGRCLNVSKDDGITFRSLLPRLRWMSVMQRGYMKKASQMSLGLYTYKVLNETTGNHRPLQ